MAHGILVTLNGSLIRLLRTEPQRAQQAPDMRLAEPHAVHALNEHSHTLDRPEFRAESMRCRALQERRPHLRQLRRFQLCRPAPIRHGTQRVNAALIEQCLPCVHRLACHANGQRNLGTTFAFLQHSTCTQSLLCCLAQSLLHHLRILQEQTCRYNA